MKIHNGILLFISLIALFGGAINLVKELKPHLKYNVWSNLDGGWVFFLSIIFVAGCFGLVRALMNK